jgi:isoleucyl-tRNA synthetase
MRGSDEIFQRVMDGYRKLRNTARFALGNLAGFEPERDGVSAGEMLEIDRWALAELDAITDKVLKAYDGFEFHSVFHLLYNFATVTLSARYFDIVKDRLYTYAPRSMPRRSAQTALHRIADSLARLLAPILVFTADEIWENLPPSKESQASVHLSTFPAVSGEEYSALQNWTALFAIRDEVLRALEVARIAKEIGSSLEAKVTLSASGKTFELLSQYAADLRYIFIVSQVELVEAAQSDVSIQVSAAEGEKCERCWNYSTRVGESAKYPTVCERCVGALDEIERA